ncbi:MAG: hypothetical protein KC563_03875, partial [Nitrospira sp.]|nr:hypothetical protein [Nitrospira sp.]
MNACSEELVKSAMVAGQWDEVCEVAKRWVEEPDCGPRPYFALNVVYLLRGDFSQAWKVFPQALAEESDKDVVRVW